MVSQAAPVSANYPILQLAAQRSSASIRWIHQQEANRDSSICKTSTLFWSVIAAAAIVMAVPELAGVIAGGAVIGIALLLICCGCCCSGGQTPSRPRVWDALPPPPLPPGSHYPVGARHGYGYPASPSPTTVYAGGYYPPSTPHTPGGAGVGSGPHYPVGARHGHGTSGPSVPSGPSSGSTSTSSGGRYTVGGRRETGGCCTNSGASPSGPGGPGGPGGPPPAPAGAAGGRYAVGSRR